jgi:glutathione synthase
MINNHHHPLRWVLKPQREGGGNNWYGDEMVAKLQAQVDLDDLILMQRILPPPQPARLVRKGVVDHGGPTLSELGVFGTFLAVDNDSTDNGGDDKQSEKASAKEGGVAPSSSASSAVVLVNEYAGHILRTKSVGVDEGGVATGYSVLSSPILV